MGKLDGKVALITGGSSGIGFATAKLFIEEGAFVYITGRRANVVEEAVKLLGGERVKGLTGDASKLSDLDNLYAEIKQTHEQIHILFANAGVAEFIPFDQVTEENFDYLFNINVKGVFFTIQKALPLLVDGSSVIINSSIAGSKGFPAATVYSATKAAVRSLARTLTSDLKQRKIRVNIISPGPVDTPILGPADQPNPFIEGLIPFIPLGRIGRPEEIAKPLLFLASDDSSFISGVELFADGGLAQI